MCESPPECPWNIEFLEKCSIKYQQKLSISWKITKICWRHCQFVGINLKPSRASEAGADIRSPERARRSEHEPVSEAAKRNVREPEEVLSPTRNPLMSCLRE